MEIHEVLSIAQGILRNATKAEQDDRIELASSYLSQLRVFLIDNLKIKPVQNNQCIKGAQSGVEKFGKDRP